MSTDAKNIESLVNRRYEHGFVTDIESDSLPPGLDEDVVRAISARKNEPDFMLEWRLKAYRHWLTMHEPEWAHVQIVVIGRTRSAGDSPQAGRNHTWRIANLKNPLRRRSETV